MPEACFLTSVKRVQLSEYTGVKDLSAAWMENLGIPSLTWENNEMVTVEFYFDFLKSCSVSWTTKMQTFPSDGYEILCICPSSNFACGSLLFDAWPLPLEKPQQRVEPYLMTTVQSLAELEGKQARAIQRKELRLLCDAWRCEGEQHQMFWSCKKKHANRQQKIQLSQKTYVSSDWDWKANVPEDPLGLGVRKSFQPLDALPVQLSKPIMASMPANSHALTPN